MPGNGRFCSRSEREREDDCYFLPEAESPLPLTISETEPIYGGDEAPVP